MDRKTWESIERLISEQQTVQMNNPPSSRQWKNASKELHRLVKLLVSNPVQKNS